MYDTSTARNNRSTGVSEAENPVAEGAIHPVLTIIFGVLFQNLSSNTYISNLVGGYGLELAVVSMVIQIALGAAYGFDNDKNSARYILGVVLGVGIVVYSNTFHLDIWGWAGAIGSISLCIVAILKRKGFILN